MLDFIAKGSQMQNGRVCEGQRAFDWVWNQYFRTEVGLRLVTIYCNFAPVLAIFRSSFVQL